MKKQTVKKIANVFKCFFLLIAGILLLLILLAFTPLPFYMHRALGTDPNASEETFIPDYVVMLGGAGMPSQSNLMRLFYTAEYAAAFEIKVILIHPKDSVCQYFMKRELKQKGIASDSIVLITEGSNTHSQLIALREQMPELQQKNLLVVTAPEQLRRTIKCFNKSGFQQVRGRGAFEATVDFDLSLKDKKMEGNTNLPHVENTNLRYTFWNYLKLEIDCFREYTALFYYKIKGWI